MHPAIRTQSDGLGDVYSLETAIDASEGGVARQEFKDEADINIMLAKFGVFAPQKEVFFGDVDYGIDLQQALFAIADAKRAWQLMPDDVKKEFPTWRDLLNGLESGRLKLNEGDPPAPEMVTTPLQSAPVAPAHTHTT